MKMKSLYKRNSMTLSIRENEIKKEHYGIIAKGFEDALKSLGYDIKIFVETELKNIGNGIEIFVNFKLIK